jgi:hypothetical protein
MMREYDWKNNERLYFIFHTSSLYSIIAFNLVFGQVTIQDSPTAIYNEAFNHPCTNATGCANKYSSLSLLAKLI